MLRFVTLIAATAVTVGLTVTGLAGTAAAEEQLSKKQFLKQANALCKDAFTALDAGLSEQFAGLGENEEPSRAQIEAAVGSLVEILGGAATDIEALAGPVALERKVDTFLDRFTTVVDAFDTHPRSTFAEELSGYPFAKSDAFAKKIGLQGCAQRR